MIPWKFMCDLSRQTQAVTGLKLTLRHSGQYPDFGRPILNAGIDENRRELWVFTNAEDPGSVSTQLLSWPRTGTAVLHFWSERDGHDWLAIFRDRRYFAYSRQLPDLLRHCRDAEAHDSTLVPATQDPVTARLMLEAGGHRRGYGVSGPIVPSAELAWAEAEFRYQHPEVAGQVLAFVTSTLDANPPEPVENPEFWVYVDNDSKLVTRSVATALWRAGRIAAVALKDGNGTWVPADTQLT